jgi:hypothetical protein
MPQVWLAARRFRGESVYYTESHSDLRVCEIAWASAGYDRSQKAGHAAAEGNLDVSGEKP